MNTRGEDSERMSHWLRFARNGIREIQCQAKASGRFEIIDARPVSIFGIGKRQRFTIGSVVHTIWFPPANLWSHSELKGGERFAAGEDVIRLRVSSGDRILVNRFLYNFRRPERGESVVIESRFVPSGPPGDFYLKRLVGFGGEALSISDDRQLTVNTRTVNFSEFGFKNAVDVSGAPEVGRFSGYLNGIQASRYGNAELATHFPSATASYRIPPNCVLVFGDNTLGSLDGRSWGGIPQNAIIGRPSLIFWPFSERFGRASR